MMGLLRPARTATPITADDPRGTAAEMRAFRATCERIVRRLPIPVPFDEHRFCAQLGAWRGRRIALRPWPLRAHVPHQILYGFVATEADHEVIVFERDTRPLHRQLIVAHEVAHLILGHRSGDLSVSDLRAAALPLSAQATIRHLHTRDGARTREEYEAEYLARLILLHANSAQARVALTSAHAADMLDMLDNIEGHSV